MSVFKIINLLDKKQTLFFILFFILSLISMIFETISIGLLIPFVSTVISDTKSENFFKIFRYFELENKNKEEILFFIAILILIVQSFKSFFLTIHSFIEQKFLTNIRAEISNKLFQIYLNKPLVYYLNNNSSEFIRNIQDSDVLRMLFRNIIQLIKELILFIGLSILVIFFEPTGSGFVIVGLLIIGYLFTKYINKKARAWGKLRQKNIGFSIKTNQEAFKLIKEIKIYKKIDFFVKKFSKLNNNIRYSELRQNFFNSLPRLWLEWLLIFIFSSLVFYYILNNNSVEDILLSLVIFAAVGIKLIPSLSKLINSIQILSYYNSIVDTISRLFLLQKNKPDIKKINYGTKIKDIKIKNLSFYYNNKNQVILNKINFKFKKNKIYGITGISGSGKTTLINIILGLLKPTSGGIYINDNINIFDQIEFWHKNIGYVQQNYSLIDDTIKNNIVFGQNNHEIEKKNFKYAIKNSKVFEFAKSKQNTHNEKIGEDGSNISGGQKQRVALARALYNRPNILILDEFTSSLDHNLEKQIMLEIKKLKKDKFIFIVSHKTSTLEVCDRILKVERKKIKVIK